MKTSLTDEILHQNLPGVERLLATGEEDVNEIDDYGYTPLIEAAIVNDVKIAELLIKHGADVNKDDVTGRTPLFWAAENDSVALSQLLLENNADPNAYTLGSQPVLANPLLRNHQELKKLLYKFGAKIDFAQDFINTKLIGHRYELIGQVDIVNHRNHFIELDFEGFILEFTVSIIYDSLKRYKSHFAARHLRDYFKNLSHVIQAFAIANELLTYQQYTIDLKQHEQRLQQLTNSDLLLLPVAYRGHAISFIKFGRFLAKCDRGENSKREGTVVVYLINNLAAFNTHFVKNLIYKRQTPEFILDGFKQVLSLYPITILPISPQVTGNCSWANIEAAIPTMLFLLSLKNDLDYAEMLKLQKSAIKFYDEWLEWEKDSALHDCIESFHNANALRKASKVSILASVLFQTCDYTSNKGLDRAEKIFPILTLPDYRYVLDSYTSVYCKTSQPLTLAGENLKQLLNYFDVDW